MSISMKSSKTQMYSEIERLRLEVDRVTQVSRGLAHELFEEKALHSDTYAALTQLKAARQARVVRAINRPNDDDRKALNAFIGRYCTKFGVKTVPGHIVTEFKRRRANDQG